jgi:aryl-alcohol dehydrogenase-like predicted oxidoreductase
MRYRRLGSSDIFISRITAGGVLRGPESEFIRGLHLAFDHGVTAVDTAPIYGCGASESAVGKAIADHRHRIVVITKAGIRWDDPRGRALQTIKDENGRERVLRLNSRPSSLELEVDRSLMRLGVERIDVLNIHQHDPDTPLEDVMGTLAKLHEDGKIRAVGLSNFPSDLVEKATKYLGRVPLASVQADYSLIARSAETEWFPLSRSNRFSLFATRVLAQGALGSRNRAVPQDARAFASEFAFTNRAKIARAVEEVIVPIAARHKATIAQVAIAWVLEHEEITSAIIGASTERQSLENVTAIDVQLASEEVIQLADKFARAGIDLDASRSIVSRAERLIRRALG